MTEHDRRLAFVRELERADEEAAIMLRELDDLYAATEQLRARAVALEAFRARLPDERAQRAQALDEAGRDVDAAEEEAARAAVELSAAQAAGDMERLASARRFDVRTRDALAVARRRVDAARVEAERLEADAAEAEREVPELEARAGDLAQTLRGRPRLAAEAGVEPAPGLGGVSEWGGRARAALLVARAGLAAEREAVIRQANELGSLVFGEPLASTRAADVARRIEGALERR